MIDITIPTPPSAIAYERKPTDHVNGVRVASRNPDVAIALQIHSDRHHMTARLSRADTERLIANLLKLLVQNFFVIAMLFN
jgi:hypothetical protein